MIEIREINSQEAFRELRDPWNHLLARSTSPNVFLTWEWLYTWWEKWGEGKELNLLVAHDTEGRLKGIAPLFGEVKRNYGVTVRQLRFLGEGVACSEYLEFLAGNQSEAEVRSELLKAAADRTDYWDMLCLEDIVFTSTFHESLKVLGGERRFKYQELPKTVSSYLRLPEDWESYLASLSRNTRRNIKKGIQKLDSLGAWSFYRWEDEEKIDDAMEILFELHGKRWEAKGQSGVFKRRKFRGFHKEVARKFAHSGWLQLFFLEVEGKPAGSMYGFGYAGRCSLYQSGFDPAFEKHGLGRLLIALTIKSCIENGFEEVDFLRGRSEYKERWTDMKRDCGEVVIADNRLKCRWVLGFEGIGRRLKEATKCLLPTHLAARVRRFRSEKILNRE